MREQGVKEKTIKFLDYIFDILIAKNIKNLFHFIVSEVINKVIIELLQWHKELAFWFTIVLTNVNIYHTIHSLKDAYGVLVVIDLTIFTLFLFKMMYNKGNVDIEGFAKDGMEALKSIVKPK
jgi:hypothetical protein